MYSTLARLSLRNACRRAGWNGVRDAYTKLLIPYSSVSGVGASPRITLSQPALIFAFSMLNRPVRSIIESGTCGRARREEQRRLWERQWHSGTPVIGGTVHGCLPAFMGVCERPWVSASVHGFSCIVCRLLRGPPPNPERKPNSDRGETQRQPTATRLTPNSDRGETQRQPAATHLTPLGPHDLGLSIEVAYGSLELVCLVRRHQLDLVKDDDVGKLKLVDQQVSDVAVVLVVNLVRELWLVLWTMSAVIRPEHTHPASLRVGLGKVRVGIGGK
eukprot:357788-Chlamydomonas_euryale.AAC.1